MPIEFNKHQNIKYHPIDRLYWGEFPYKVVSRLSQRFRCRNARSRARDELLTKFVNDHDLIYRTSMSGFSFFFTDALSATTFIDNNHSLITEVHSPVTPSEIAALKTEKTVLRNTLWFGKYQYVMVIHCPYNENVEHLADIDSFVTETFGDDPARYLYKSTPTTRQFQHRRSRRLYLADQSDLVLTKLSIDGAFINKIRIAIVRDELTG